MQPCAFDRTVPKGAAGGGAASFLQQQQSQMKKSSVRFSDGRVVDSDDDGTASDEDVLKMTDATMNARNTRRRSSAFQVSSSGNFATPGGETALRGSSSDKRRRSSAAGGGGASGSPTRQRSLSDKFFDPKLVRIRAETNRKKSNQRTLEASGLSDEAAALGPAAAKTASKSARLVSGELKCDAQFAPCVSCIDENPSDILRPQAPPPVEHATMVSFEAENMLVLFGGLCINRNDAIARATVSPGGGKKQQHDNEFGSDDNDFDKNPDVSEMPEAGVASNTTWIYDSKNLIWSCITEADLVSAKRNEQHHRAHHTHHSEEDDDDESAEDEAAAMMICPAPRCGHTAVAMFDDPFPQKTKLPTASRVYSVKNEYAREPMMVIFGGCDLRKQVSYGDVWAFFIRTKKWKCLFDCAAIPRGNLTFSLDLIPSDPAEGFDTKEKMSFFPDDAEFFDGADVKARLLALTGKVTGSKLHSVATSRRPIRKARPPCQRWKAVAGALDDLMFVFGGESSTFEVLDDLHTFNVTTKQWEVMRTRMSPWPSARFMHSACVVGTKMIVSGGTGKRSDIVMEDDTWILEMRTVMWRQVMGTSEILNTATSPAEALNRCPFLTRPRHVQQLPVVLNPTEKRLELKAGGNLNASTMSSLNQSQQHLSPKRNQVARCEVEGPVLLPFDDRIVFYGGREVPTGRFVHNIYILDLISERWFKADDVMMDQSNNLMLHGDVNQLTPMPITEKTDSMLPAKRWAHCGCAVVKYSATRSMSLSRSLSEVAHECGGNNICGTVRFTDQKAIDKYIEELQKDVQDQANFDGVLGTRNNQPIMSHTLRAFFFGGGATCSGTGGGNSKRAELSDCWQLKLELVERRDDDDDNAYLKLRGDGGGD